MRTSTQFAVLALLGGLGAGWHFYGDRVGLPKPLALLGLEARERAAAAGSSAPLGVAVSPVRLGTVTERTESVGSVRARDAVTITAKVTGLVTAIRFGEGQMVREGEPLVLLDDVALRAELDQARAMLDDARSQLQRAQRLESSQSIAAQRVDTLAAQARQAEGRVRQTQAKVEELRIVAPFSGRVGLRQISLGALIQPGTTITTLDDTARVRVEFAVPEVFLARVRAGGTVTARSAAYGERRFRGTVTVVDTRIDTATRTVRMVSEFDNADEALRPGLFLTVELLLDQRDGAMLIPEEAIDPVGDKAFVFVVRDDRVRRVEVALGQRLPGEVEIRRGLGPDDRVVVRGVNRLRNDAPVRVTETLSRPTS